MMNFNNSTAYNFTAITGGNASVNQSNSSVVTVDDYACLRSPHYRNTLITLFIIAIVMSAIENMMLWFVFITKKKLRSVAIGYLISLSASDFITAASLAWLEIVYVHDYPDWIFGEMGSFTVNGFWCFSLVTPFTHIVFITIDRYRAVTSATLYSQSKSWRSELVKIGFIWFYSIGMCLLFAFYFSPASDEYYEWNVRPEWYYPFIAVHIVIPLIIGTTMYMKMVAHVRQHRKETKNLSENRSLKEFQFARAVAIIIVFLYVVWVPVIALECIYALYAHTCLIAQLGTISVWLTCTSGVINPIIFLSRNAPFRNAICCFSVENVPVVNRFLSTKRTTATSTVRGVSTRYKSTIVSKPNTSEINISQYEKENDNISENNVAQRYHLPSNKQNNHAPNCVRSRKEVGFINQALEPDSVQNLVRPVSPSHIDATVISKTRSDLTSTFNDINENAPVVSS